MYLLLKVPGFTVFSSFADLKARAESFFKKASLTLKSESIGSSGLAAAEVLDAGRDRRKLLFDELLVAVEVLDVVVVLVEAEPRAIGTN